ncbi:MAG: hypothetical protein ACTSWE_01700, partial [Promethearchaeota archaeon]
MDTESDFITTQFLHLIFFEQRNVLIYPHVDLKYLNALEIFTVGYTFIPIDATALTSVNDILEANVYSTIPNFYLIYNLNLNDIKAIMQYPSLHYILNTHDNAKELLSKLSVSSIQSPSSAFSENLTPQPLIFYNKKSKRFLNYDFIARDLSFEKKIIERCPTLDLLRDELLKIKHLAGQIYILLNEGKSIESIQKFLSKSHEDENEQEKILRFMEHYYGVRICHLLKKASSLDDDNSISTENIYESKDPLQHYREEYQALKKLPGAVKRMFVSCMEEYCLEHVNTANLEDKVLINPENRYLYLRQNHWKQGLPENFLRTWLKSVPWEAHVLDIHSFLQLLGFPSNKIDSLFTSLSSSTSLDNFTPKEDYFPQELTSKKRERVKKEKEKRKPFLKKDDLENSMKISFPELKIQQIDIDSLDFDSHLADETISNGKGISQESVPIQIKQEPAPSPQIKEKHPPSLQEKSSPIKQKILKKSEVSKVPSLLELERSLRFHMNSIDQKIKQLQDRLSQLKKHGLSVPTIPLVFNQDHEKMDSEREKNTDIYDKLEEIESIFRQGQKYFSQGENEPSFRTMMLALGLLMKLLFKKLFNGSQPPSYIAPEKIDTMNLAETFMGLEYMLKKRLTPIAHIKYVESLYKKLLQGESISISSEKYEKIFKYLSLLYEK